MAGKMRGPTKSPGRRRRTTKPAPPLVSIASTRTEGVTAKAIVKMPPPPKNLKPLALEYWALMIEAMGDRLQPIDAMALATFCEISAEWINAGLKLEKTGGSVILHPKTKTRYRNPWLDIQKGARRELSVYYAMFGLSPHDRIRLGLENPHGGRGPSAPNPFDEFKN